MRGLIAAAVAACSLIFTAGVASAQDYPNRPITMIVPFQAGGPTDTLGRTLAAAMGRALGQQVQVEIVDGAGGTVGATRAAQAAPDGYTILLYHVGMATTPTLFPDLPYDPLTDFAEIGIVAEVPMVLVSRQRFPASSFDQLIAYVQSHLDSVTMAHAGIGSASHLCATVFQALTGLDIVTVPYSGTAQALLDLTGDFVDLLCDQTTSIASNIQDGRVKAFFLTQPERMDQISEVPTYQEVGLSDEMAISVWHGLWAPAGTPPEIIAKLNSAMQAALRDRQVIRTLSLFATQPAPLDEQTPEALHQRVADQIEYWRPILQAAGQYIQ
jgi:tripartite-type tricarboxylate transporter receptor subunit TctC